MKNYICSPPGAHSTMLEICNITLPTEDSIIYNKLKILTLLLSRVTSASGVSHISYGNPSSTLTPRFLRPLRVLNVTLSSGKLKKANITFNNVFFQYIQVMSINQKHYVFLCFFTSTHPRPPGEEGTPFEEVFFLK